MELTEKVDLIVLTKDGQFGGIISRTYEDALANADLIHASMITIIKDNKENNNGLWAWIFYDNFKYILGEKQ